MRDTSPGRATALIAPLLIAWVLAAGCSAQTPPPRRQVAIAAASDLRFALDEVVAALRQEDPGLEVKVTYGSSGNLYAQLVNHAPHDMFLSADSEYPRRLAEQGLVLPGTEFLYGVGRLVLWVPGSVAGELGMALLTQPSVTRIAIANPEHAPYGVAAVEALRAAKVYDAVRDKLVYGDNVTQALQFARSGAAQAAIIARALVLAPGLGTEGRVWDIPPAWHSRMEQQGVILRSGTDPGAAQEVRAFLMSDQGRAILLKYGFAGAGA